MLAQTEQNELDKTAIGYKPLLKAKVDYMTQQMIAELRTIGVSKDAIAKYMTEMFREIGTELVMGEGKKGEKRMIKYCDRCKWDEITQSKAIPDNVRPEELDECPACGNELCEATDYSEIP